MTSEQEALLRKAYSSLAAARLLANQKYYDFSISRVYYAMFYVAPYQVKGCLFQNIQL
jgi:uncharacterized protein (UPF0332 family)